MAMKQIRGLGKVLRNLNREIRKIEDNSQEGLIEAGLLIKGRAQEKTPVVDGNLRNSAFLTFPKGVEHKPSFTNPGMKSEHNSEVTQSRSRTKSAKKGPAAEVGFSASYALSVHENKRSGKTGGKSPQGKQYKPPKGSNRKAFSTVGEWKFLESAFKESHGEVLGIVKRSARVR